MITSIHMSCYKTYFFHVILCGKMSEIILSYMCLIILDNLIKLSRLYYYQYLIYIISCILLRNMLVTFYIYISNVKIEYYVNDDDIYTCVILQHICVHVILYDYKYDICIIIINIYTCLHIIHNQIKK